MKAPVSEIFFSYQGEGICVGQPQIFVRFYGCNIRCDYCDTPQNQRLSGLAIKRLSAEEIVKKINSLSIKKFSRGQQKVVSLTGGEPLLHTPFLLNLLPLLKKQNYQVYLETNGTMPREMKKVYPFVDVVAMDIKLPSSCGGIFRGEHSRFLYCAKKKAFIKVVVDGKTTAEEFEKAVLLVNKISPAVPFVIQPATPSKSGRGAAPEDIYRWYRLAIKHLRNVSLMPQMHKWWGIR